MATRKPKPELIVIVGPTASGKSELAMRTALRYNGEVISADSRSTYKVMEIGTAKPSSDDQHKVKHWGLDLVNPDEQFTVKEFKDYATAAISDIRSRGKLPILVGGSGLYIDAVVFDYEFEVGLPDDPINPRHRHRPKLALEPIKNALIIGLDPGKEELEKRVRDRVDVIVGPKFIDEVKKLLDSYPPNLEVFKTPGYLPASKYLDGELNLEELKKEFVQGDLRLAKKQRTWFKRNKYILWQTDVDSAEHTINKLMNT